MDNPSSDLIPLPPITTTALDLRVQIDVALVRLGLTWKSEQVKRWMKRSEVVASHPVTCPADLPDEALRALLHNLDVEVQKGET